MLNFYIEPIKVELALDHDALKALQGDDKSTNQPQTNGQAPLGQFSSSPSAPAPQLGTLEALALGAILGSGSKGVLGHTIDSQLTKNIGK